MLPVFKGTDLEESTDSCLIISITLFLDINEASSIGKLADYVMEIGSVRDYSLSIRATFDSIKSKFLKEFEEYLEIQDYTQEAYLLIQKDITDAEVRNRNQEDKEIELITIDSSNDLIFLSKLK